jgi:queuine tRNA-ribosyltransferase
LFIADEALGPRLLTLHNVRFFLSLVAGVRQAIAQGDFSAWTRTFLARYGSVEPTQADHDANQTQP